MAHTLPIYDRSRGGREARAWWPHVVATYPDGWFDLGGPLRLYAAPRFDRREAGRPRRRVHPPHRVPERSLCAVEADSPGQTSLLRISTRSPKSSPPATPRGSTRAASRPWRDTGIYDLLRAPAARCGKRRLTGAP
ncbi:DUF6349 family protein [Streptomyces sp. AMCC400023]|uniref:DUF6349 family protein n=1 Tax=Streptomyces sp. AMCC400023 TaxID=2056258 RepID=UPI003FA7A379